MKNIFLGLSNYVIKMQFSVTNKNFAFRESILLRTLINIVGSKTLVI